MDFNHQQLVDHLVETNYLKTPHIIEAFRVIDRADFVPEEIKAQAYINTPLPIGWGQTISQPLTVAFMLELLQPEPGDKILDIGSGSGWQTALLAHLVGKNGKIFAIERLPELKDFGQENVTKYNFIKKGIVEFICGDGSKGLSSQAPFDKIIAAASAQEIPRAWKEQLKIGGRLVAPVGGSIWLLIKKDEKPSPRVRLGPGGVGHQNKVSGEGDFEEKEYPGFVFVPLVNEEQ